MPELRSGARRRGRSPPTPVPPAVDRPLRNTRARAAAAKKPEPAGVAAGGSRRVRTRAAAPRPASAKGRQRVRSAKGRQILVEEGEGRESDRLKDVVLVEEEKRGEGLVSQPEEKRGKEMMGDESGGLSANRATRQEEEGNTNPFPDKVFS
ncbi:hypothetical protein BHE74_00050942 [Ensete ventricosum]|nr:hypothetical protein BHE74_00050942 [Ensete ventricosum]RZS23208.1 hypothetical protein BHM03_00056096 [Ensete ventricosum]